MSNPSLENLSDAAQVKSRSIAAVKILFGRTLLTLVARIFGSVALARLLLPHDYGVFAIASWVIGIGMYLADVGLAGALVHQHREPTPDEEVTVFITQQILTGLLVLFLCVAAKYLTAASHLPVSAVPILRLMALSLFASSIRVIPMMSLERRLNFRAIAQADIAQTVVNIVVNISLAWLGWGAWCLPLGAISGAVISSGIIWMRSPWTPTGRFSFAILRRLVKFGFSFQLNGAVPTLLGGWIPVVVGHLYGVSAVGIVNWAVALSATPMMLSAVLNRVAFPAYCRLQADPEALAKYVRATFRRLIAALALSVPLGIILCPPLIPIIFKARWAPAIPLVQWLSVETMLLTLVGVLAQVQNASGNPADRLVVTIVAGTLRWTLGYAAARLLGLSGIGPAMILVASSELAFSTWMISRRVPALGTITREIATPLLLWGAALGGSILVARSFSADPWIRSGVGLCLFGGLLAIHEISTGGSALVGEMRRLLVQLRPVGVAGAAT